MTTPAKPAPVAEPYKIAPHPPLISQVCQRCGAEIGDRALHDYWHDYLDECQRQTEARTSGSRCPHA